MSFDVGQNLTFLGIAFLFLKYLLPVLIGLILIAASVWLFQRILPSITGQLYPGGYPMEWLILAVCGLLILAIVLLI